MKIVFEHIHSPVWVDGSHLAVTLYVKLAHLSQDIPFTATHDDVVPHGREIYQRAVSGEFGLIAEFVPPTSSEIAAQDNPGIRQQAMMLAITKAQHHDMMGNSGLGATWRAYYQQIYALDMNSDWPIVAKWPEVPE